MSDLADLQLKVASYSSQLQQIEAVLNRDPTNEQFLKLKQDLQKVIALTEQLINSRKQDEDTSDNDTDRVAAPQGIGSIRKGAANEIKDDDSCPFQIGDVVEAVTADRPFAAVVKAILPETKECTVKYFEFEAPVNVLFKDLAHISRPALAAHNVTSGYRCQAKFSADQRWYDAVVDSVTEFGFIVTFLNYGNTEEVPLSYIRPMLTKKEKPKEEGSALINIPEALKILPTDTEEVEYTLRIFL